MRVGALYFEPDPSFQHTPYSRYGIAALKMILKHSHVLKYTEKRPSC